MIESVSTEKSQDAVRMPTGALPAQLLQRVGRRAASAPLHARRQGGVRLVDPAVDADLVAVIGHGADLLGCSRAETAG
jgi:hypothetical protein